jgi:hypothetical protein
MKRALPVTPLNILKGRLGEEEIPDHIEDVSIATPLGLQLHDLP